MKVLFIGGTGNVSRACTEEALRRGYEVFHLNRGIKNAGSSVQDSTRANEGIRSQARHGDERHSESLTDQQDPVVHLLKADIHDREAVARACTVNISMRWYNFSPLGLSRLQLISSFFGESPTNMCSSAPHQHTKSHRSRRLSPRKHRLRILTGNIRSFKITCERVLIEESKKDKTKTDLEADVARSSDDLRRGGPRLPESFPWTIVRPSHTYNDGWIPSCFGSEGYGLAWRLLQGLEIVVPGDGQSLWTLTYAPDFAVGLVGLLGNKEAIGHAFHITSDEHLTWDAIHTIVANSLGVKPHIVHIPSDLLQRSCLSVAQRSWAINR